MGNNSSSAATRCGSSPFRRSTGSLGLSKTELDSRCKPSGLYENCKWEQRQIRRAIGDGKLAARLSGTESRECGSDQECPICFLHYSQINMIKCCNATICTECYLQVQEPPKSQNPSHPCPFCNHDKIAVTIAKKLVGEDVAKREKEEQMVIEATIRARKNSESSVNSDTSSLMMPAERENLEREMRSQCAHPIMTRLRREEDERRERHDEEYNRRSRESNSMFQRNYLTRRGMDDDVRNYMRTFGRSGTSGLNDLVMLEALLLSMNNRNTSTSSSLLEATDSGSSETSASASSSDPARRRNPLLQALMRRRSRDVEEEDNFNNVWDFPDRNLDPLIRSGFLGDSFPSYSEDEQMAMAIAMSLREEEASQERNRVALHEADVTDVVTEVEVAEVSELSEVAEVAQTDVAQIAQIEEAIQPEVEVDIEPEAAEIDGVSNNSISNVTE